MMRNFVLALLVVVAGAIGWVAFDWYRTLSGGDPYGAPFELVGHNGEQITQADFRAQPAAIFFGFTHCPEVCPTTLFEMDGWLKKLGDEGKDVKAYFVSVDPERDTPAILDDYIANFSPRITGITGNPDEVAAMVKSFGIYARKVELDDGDYTMDHTASVILLDSDGDFFGTIAYGESADNAKAKLRRLASEGALSRPGST